VSNKKTIIEQACNTIVKDFDGVLDWTWDNRFGALIAEFTKESQDKVISILSKHLTMKWDKKSIKKAPPIIKTNTELFGTLRRGQLFFTTDPETSDHIVAAWWPWGDGQSISVRIVTPD